MTKYQYKLIPTAQLSVSGWTLEEKLQELGQDGWLWMGNDWGLSIFAREVEAKS